MEDHSHHDHDKHAGHSPALFQQKFWLSLILTIPIVLYSPTVMELFGYRAPEFPGSRYIPAVLGVIIFFYGGIVFLKSARTEIQAKQPGMMTLISLAISVAFAYSLAVTLGLPGMDFWWELATLVVIMLLGHWIEMASIQSAQGALKELAKLLPDEAEMVMDEHTHKVAVEELKVGDVVLVRPGAAIPADGVVTIGWSSVNESLLTGESTPVEKTTGGDVIAGSINGSGALTVRVAKTGGDTALAGIMRLVGEAEKSKSYTQVIADRAAYYLTFIAIAAAILTAIGWVIVGGHSPTFILERAVTVLIIACPHALGLAVPLVVAISTSLAARNGLLVRKRSALESARNIDVVLFDKTGTLTKGEQGVVGVVTDEFDETSAMSLAATVENESEHPIARAIVEYAKAEGIKLADATNFTALPGRGARARADGKVIAVGGPKMITEMKAAVSDALLKAYNKASHEGKTAVYVIRDKRAVALLMLADVIRPESKEAVRSLEADGKRVALLTGDAEGVAAWVAKELGITEYYAEILPEHKADVVKKLQASGCKVAMVGDGVNDAPALVQADVGIAIGAGTDIAIESAGIILVSSDPRGVAKVVTLSRKTYRKMIENLAWGTGYNIIAIPAATGMLYGFGIVLSPALGAVLMSLSTIIVAVNAQLLRRLQL